MRAECLFKSEEFEESIEAFLQAQAQPAQSETMRVLTYLHGGQAAAQLERWEVSLRWIDQLIRKFPETPYLPQAFYEQGWAQRNLGRLDEALAAFDRVTEKSRSAVAARARFMMGEIHFEKKEFDQAIRQYRRVMFGYGGQQAPDDVRAWQARSALEAGRCATVLAGQQQPGQRREQYLKGARAFFDYVIQNHPQSEVASTAREQLQRLGTP
jgi:tetratricopeptide (TPR) repeat protein